MTIPYSVFPVSFSRTGLNILLSSFLISGYRNLLVDSTPAFQARIFGGFARFKINRASQWCRRNFETKVVEVQRIGLGEISLNQIPAQIF
ncbi:MAG: hypothetical protein R2769_07270 [Saprospiraceae bacterium]